MSAATGRGPRRAVVWGLGRFGGGLAALRHLRQSGFAVDIIDRRSPSELAAALEDAGMPVGETRFLLEEPRSLDEAELVVLNPAIRPTHPLLADVARRGLRTTQELDLAIAEYPGRAVAVTGTNGKSSTAAMLHLLLQAAGQSCLLAGNIGRSLFEDRSVWQREQIAVVEVSSFQAARFAVQDRFELLLVTNLGEDHLDWHGALERYHEDKMRLAGALQPGAAVIGHAHDTAFEARAGNGIQARVLRLGAEPEYPSVTNRGAVHWKGRELLPHRGEFPRATVMRENAAVALAAAQWLGFDPEEVAPALREFQGLPHRLERLPARFGIDFVDNGVSTVARSSEVAIEELATDHPVHWVCGGRPKSPELDAHVACARSCASVHVFGEVAPRLVALLQRDSRTPPCSGPHADLRSALGAACRRAAAGEVVLFSPAFSSHDAYPNFAVRAAEARSFWADFELR